MFFPVFAVFCLVTSDSPEPQIDGKSLAGWDGVMEHWKVADGAITGKTDGKLKNNTFLCTQKKFKDFELTFQVRVKDGVGNSGIQFRSEVFDRDTWRVKGPQADIGQKHWGTLYGEEFGGLMQAADWDKVGPKVKPADFNDYFLRVVGKKVTIRVNSIVTVDKEFPTVPDEGIIAIQLHAGPAMEIAIKNIKLKELK